MAIQRETLTIPKKDEARINEDASAPKAPAYKASAPKPPQRTRVPFNQIGGRMKMRVPQEIIDYFDSLDMHLAWVNDTPGNSDAYFAAGCEYVLKTDIPEHLQHLSFGDPDAGRSGDAAEDSRIKVWAGANRFNTGPMFAYLLKKPKAFHDEDMQNLEDNLVEMEQGMKAGNTQGGPTEGVENVYGEVKIGRE